MGRIRNPRYAPEFLERRLSPSSFVASRPAAYSVTTTTDPTEPPPGPGDGTPPVVPPTDPTTPGYPA